MDYKTAQSYVGNPAQLFGIKNYTFDDGRAAGVQAADIKSGAGLEFTVLKSKCMDIAALSYKGINVSFLSKTGIVHPSYYHEDGARGFLRCFHAGMLTTCGLTYMGAPCKDGDRVLGLHGPIHNTPAQACRGWVDDAAAVPVARLSGRMREACVFEENMVLQRDFSCEYGENKVTITDTITNEGFAPQPLMLLYHFNLGFPFLCEDTVVQIPHEAVYPRDAEALKGIKAVAQCEAPKPACPEQCYFYAAKQQANGHVVCRVTNVKLGLIWELDYDAQTLPYLTQWKSMTSGDYALGIEPGTYTPEGRAQAKAQNKLSFLKPGETKVISLAISVMEIAKT